MAQVTKKKPKPVNVLRDPKTGKVIAAGSGESVKMGNIYVSKGGKKKPYAAPGAKVYVPKSKRSTKRAGMDPRNLDPLNDAHVKAYERHMGKKR